jgi:large subunit ribosomal protein L25
MENLFCPAKKRDFTGKGAARKIRQLGYIPAVLYSTGASAVSLLVNPKDIMLLIKKTDSTNPVFSMTVEGENISKKVLLKDFQVHPVKRNLLHCDFLEVRDDMPVVVNVPVRTTGKSEAEKFGGIVHILSKTLKIKCLPSQIPTAIEVDVTGLMPGQSIYIEDLKIPAGAIALYTKNIAVVGARTVKEEIVEVKPEAVEGVPEAAEGEEAEKAEKGEKPEKGEKAEKADKKEPEPAKKGK